MSLCLAPQIQQLTPEHLASCRWFSGGNIWSNLFISCIDRFNQCQEGIINPRTWNRQVRQTQHIYCMLRFAWMQKHAVRCKPLTFTIQAVSVFRISIKSNTSSLAARVLLEMIWAKWISWNQPLVTRNKGCCNNRDNQRHKALESQYVQWVHKAYIIKRYIHVGSWPLRTGWEALLTESHAKFHLTRQTWKPVYNVDAQYITQCRLQGGASNQAIYEALMA